MSRRIYNPAANPVVLRVRCGGWVEEKGSHNCTALQSFVCPASSMQNHGALPPFPTATAD